MPSPFDVILGGKAYKASALTFGQFLDVLDAEKAAVGDARAVYESDANALRLALRNAGELPDLEGVIRGASVPEIKQAVEDVCRFTVRPIVADAPPGKAPSP
jgi:hypothetical protein